MNPHIHLLVAVSLIHLVTGSLSYAADDLSANITIQGGTAGTPVAPTLYGIFYEDINYAADGGLYAELVQNRSFDYLL